MTNIIIKAPCFPLHVPLCRFVHMSLFKINTLVNVLCTRVGKISFAMQETDLQDCIKLHNLGHVPITVSPYSTRIDCWADHHLILLSSPPNIGEVSPPPPARLLFITTRTFVCTFCISLVYLYSTLAII